MIFNGKCLRKNSFASCFAFMHLPWVIYEGLQLIYKMYKNYRKNRYFPYIELDLKSKKNDDVLKIGVQSMLSRCSVDHRRQNKRPYLSNYRIYSYKTCFPIVLS